MNNKKLKAIALSLGLAMMVPATLNAQINRGLLQNPYKDQDDSRRGGMLRQGSPVDITEDSFTNGNFEEEDPNAPLGSGIAILIGAGLGYVALKKKEDKQ